MQHTIKTTSDGFECTCGATWPVPRGDDVSEDIVTGAASRANRHADEENGHDARYRADRRARQREEFQPIMLALVACGILARSEMKPKRAVEEAQNVVNAIWEACP